MPIEVLYRDGGVIAVNKPAELPTQAAEGIESLQSRLREELEREHEYLEFPHRLDRGVSGVILAATSKKVARLLSDQFASRKTEKRYVALVAGVPEFQSSASTSVSGEQSDNVWRDHLRKIDGVARVELCDENALGAKLAETHLEAVSPSKAGDCSRLVLRPITGRMHQLRIQAASRGHAILGDSIYATEVPEGGDSDTRIHLHACEITFHHPKTGKRVTVSCAADERFDLDRRSGSHPVEFED
ncbi:RluA family pseudouridine synthase [Stieleria varia]|nr:RluA family pseudouridine synthase [Stieleria varia]